jgi:ankyrin repeat protein
VVHALIQAGADLKLAMNDGTTPLHVAYQQGHVEMVHALIQAGADSK